MRSSATRKPCRASSDSQFRGAVRNRCAAQLLRSGVPGRGPRTKRWCRPATIEEQTIVPGARCRNRAVGQRSPPPPGSGVGQSAGAGGEQRRLLIRGVGAAGEVDHLGRLIRQMADEALIRWAGKSFVTILGEDLAWLHLERKSREDVQAGPSECPGSALSPRSDDSLSWPDPARVERGGMQTPCESRPTSDESIDA